MRINIIQIGNSKGIRLPKYVFKSCHFQEAVDLEIEDDKVILRNIERKPRHNWDSSFKKMALAGDDKLLDEYSTTSWDVDEWKW